MTNPFDNPGGVAVAGTEDVPQQPAVQAVKAADPYSVQVPSGVSGVRLSDEGIIDTLLMVEPLEYIASMTTSASPDPTDAFRVNILPLEGPLAGQLQENVLIFQLVPKRELKRTYSGPSRWLLAYNHMGEKKKGKNAPYLFDPPTEAQMAIYEQFRASKASA